MPTPGARIYGLAAIALGLVGLVWADFASVWQPVPPEWPARTALAYAWGGLFLAGGLTLQRRRTAAVGAWLVAGLFLPFAFLWAKRILGFPQLFGTWSGLCEQLAMILGGLAIVAMQRPAEAAGTRRLALAVRLLFGLCLLAFGAAHFLALEQTAAAVPPWLPFGGRFWAEATGLCHALAGLALLSGVRMLLAARLLTAMFVGFGLLVWLPRLFDATHEQITWAGNAINLVLTGAAWAVADMIAKARRAKQERPAVPPASSEGGS